MQEDAIRQAVDACLKEEMMEFHNEAASLERKFGRRKCFQVALSGWTSMWNGGMHVAGCWAEAYFRYIQEECDACDRPLEYRVATNIEDRRDSWAIVDVDDEEHYEYEIDVMLRNVALQVAREYIRQKDSYERRP